MTTIIGTTTCSLIQASRFNSMNDRESLHNNHRKIVRDKLQSRDYSWCKIKIVVQWTSQW